MLIVIMLIIFMLIVTVVIVILLIVMAPFKTEPTKNVSSDIEKNLL
jgi:hypothetical protein